MTGSMRAPFPATGSGRPRLATRRGRKARRCSPERPEPGKSWHSRSPDPDDKDDKLNQALKDSFPASDPPQPAQPGVTGWDLTEEEKKKQKSAA